MAQIMLINPTSPPKGKARKNPVKKGAKNMAKKKRTAAQKAATRRMIAANKARAGKTVHRKKAASPVAKAAKRRVKRRAMNTVAGYYPNPIRRRVKRRRNPIGFNTNAALGIIKPAAVQAGGGLLLNFAMSYITGMLPVSLQSGIGRNAVELVTAVAIGAFGGKVVSRGMAKDLAQGAATITLYNLAKSSIQKASPEMGARLNGADTMDWELEGLGYYSNAVTFAPTDNMAGVGELYGDQQQVGELYDLNF